MVYQRTRRGRGRSRWDRACAGRQQGEGGRGFATEFDPIRQRWPRTCGGRDAFGVEPICRLIEPPVTFSKATEALPFGCARAARRLATITVASRKPASDRARGERRANQRETTSRVAWPRPPALAPTAVERRSSGTQAYAPALGTCGDSSPLCMRVLQGVLSGRGVRRLGPGAGSGPVACRGGVRRRG